MATKVTPGRRTRSRTGATAAADHTGTQSTHLRFAARTRRLRRRARRVWVWPAAVLALVVAVVVTLWWSPAFVVQKVTVTGVDADMATGAEQRAGVTPGEPLARVDTDAVAARVEEDLRVDRAAVSRDWPSGVAIDVVLREPAMAIEQTGSSSVQLADSSGVVYDKVLEPPSDLMLVRASRREVRAASLSGVVSLRSALPPEVAQAVSDMQVTADGDLRFRVGSVAVEWGRPGQEDLKATVLEALLAQEQIDPESDQQVGVDLATPQTPVVTGLIPDEEP